MLLSCCQTFQREGPHCSFHTRRFINKPMMGIEPITYRLQGDCSAIELHRRLFVKPYDYTRGFLRQQPQSLSGFKYCVNVICKCVWQINLFQLLVFYCDRDKAAAYNATAPAAEAFNDSICPFMGIRIRKSQRSRTSLRSPLPSLPTTRQSARFRSAVSIDTAFSSTSNPATQISSFLRTSAICARSVSYTHLTLPTN